MYLAIDIGGTKTLVASLDNNGVVQERHKFPTPKDYSVFIKDLAEYVDKLSTKEFIAAGIGVPGKIDRKAGVAVAFGSLTWHNAPIQKDVQEFVHCPICIENDANLAGLSEAMLLKEHQKVLYVTISTGIGTGFIVNQKIDPSMIDSEGGNILLEYHDKSVAWEDIVSGRAIFRRFGKHATEINDKKTWHIIAHDIAMGLIDLIALMQPDVIVLGGSIGGHYEKFRDFLQTELNEYANPLFTVPVIKEAARPALAVIYGCYDLARQKYGDT